MRKPDDNKLDRLFREGLNKADGNAAFREDDWEAMEELLGQKREKRDRFFWLYWLSGGIAAMLILFFGWALFKPVLINKNRNQITKHTVQNTTKSNAHHLANRKTGTNTAVEEKLRLAETPLNKTKFYSDKNSIGTEDRSLKSEHAGSKKAAIAAVTKTGINVNSDQKNLDEHTNNLGLKEASEREQHLSPEKKSIAQTQLYAGKRSIDTNVNELVALQARTNFPADPASALVIPVAKNLIAKTKPSGQLKYKKVIQQMPPRFSLAILSAPDLNGVNSFTGAKIGANADLQFSVQLTRKFSINTGAVYASKPYEINMAQYQSAATYWGKPGEVAANCKVLDVPLNLNYQLYSKNRSSFGAGAGVSSYFMLRENYNFYYTDNTSYSRNIVNQNKHLLGVLNLNATYQRQVNPNFNLIVQPYLKLPLTPIGYEKISLQTAGVAIGVGWNISSFKNR